MTREDDLKAVPFRKVDRSTWPPGVRSIGLDELDALGVDINGQLYWHGKLVEIRRPVVLTMWQKVGAIAVAAATVGMAALDLLRYIAGR